MLRLHVHVQPIRVAADGVDHILPHAPFPQQFRRLDAMLLGKLLEIDIVQQPHEPPELLLIGKAQFPGIPAHHPLHRQRMLQMKRVLVILPQQLHRRLPGNLAFHLSLT